MYLRIEKFQSRTDVQQKEYAVLQAKIERLGREYGNYLEEVVLAIETQQVTLATEEAKEQMEVIGEAMRELEEIREALIGAKPLEGIELEIEDELTFVQFIDQAYGTNDNLVELLIEDSSFAKRLKSEIKHWHTMSYSAVKDKGLQQVVEEAYTATINRLEEMIIEGYCIRMRLYL